LADVSSNLAAVKAALISFLLAANAFATTISVVPIHEPLSLHGTDVDDIISDTGEALQAAVLPRPMALTGAFPEVLVESIRSPHPLPSNNPNYKVTEANLLVLCQVGINAEMTQTGLLVSLDVSELKIPAEIDLTSRQLLKITLVALQRTLEDYIRPQLEPLDVMVAIEGTNEKNETLKDLQITFKVAPTP
jgi:hypothetical protein